MQEEEEEVLLKSMNHARRATTGKNTHCILPKKSEGSGSFSLAVQLSNSGIQNQMEIKESIKTGMYLMAKFLLPCYCWGRDRGNKCHAKMHGRRSWSAFSELQRCLVEQDWIEKSENFPRQCMAHLTLQAQSMLAQVQHSLTVHTGIFCLGVWVLTGSESWLWSGETKQLTFKLRPHERKGQEPPANPSWGTATRRIAAASDKKSHCSLSCHASVCSKRNYRTFKPIKKQISM